MKPLNKLEDLIDVIVPSAIRDNSPQFYGLIQAFLRNLEQVQTSINSNFLDTIDYNKIQNINYKKVILDIYLNTLDLKNEPNLDALGDMIDVSKNLSLIKGTELIYEILTRLLLFIIPGIGTQYNLLVQEYNNPLTALARKQELEVEILQLEYLSYNEGIVTINETLDGNGNVVPFVYETVIDLDILYYEKYIKPFAHISGWEETFTWGIKNILTDQIDMWDKVNLYDTFDYPLTPADGTVVYDGTIFPDTTYLPAVLGPIANLAAYTGLIYNTLSISSDATNVYYNWDKFRDLESLITEGENIIIKSPAYDNMQPSGGGYLSNTSQVGTMNGALSCGSLKLSHKIVHQNKKYYI